MKKMKKSTIVIVALLVAVAAVAVVYRMMNSAPDASLSPSAQVSRILDDGGCLSCHSATPQLPFYASWPIAGDMVKADADSGYRAFDIVPLADALASGGEINPVDLAKVEKVIKDGRMPMPEYYLVHWGSTTTDEKRDIVLAWAKNMRAQYYADGLEGDMAGEPVRPIVPPTDIDSAKVALGFSLYHDARLSTDNTVSCASCHGLETVGVDNRQYSEGVAGQFGGVNAPTVYNAVYNFVQFWDGRAKTLAEQAAGPPLNPVEMASTSFDEIIAKLQADREFAKSFLAVYPDGITQENITDAIEEFERTLVTPNAPFDKYLRGDVTAISDAQKDGYELFKKYDCATCHVGPNLGGQSYELMGLRRHYFTERGTELTNEDNGRFKETGQERDRHRFKVPGLRNVALTWPYYHDGTRVTLEDAVRDMARYQSGVELDDAQVAQIVDFLNSLTGEYKGATLVNANTPKE